MPKTWRTQDAGLGRLGRLGLPPEQLAGAGHVLQSSPMQLLDVDVLQPPPLVIHLALQPPPMVIHLALQPSEQLQQRPRAPNRGLRLGRHALRARLGVHHEAHWV